jgi:hypothetical protein
MPDGKMKPRDLRRYSRQTNLRLVIGFLFLLFVVGGGLIYWFYGREAALLGIICMLGGLAPVVLIWLVLAFLGWLAKKGNE